jgi:asparagine synthase (glutamine-hydrolysing)
MSMANSLELRTPFLDYRLVEWAARTAPEVKVGPGNHGQLLTKRILRRYAESRLPRSIIDRPKQGFPVPLYEWLTGRLRNWADDLLFGPEAWLIRRFNAIELRRLFTVGSDPASEILDKHRLWNLLLLELWMREWHPT